MNTSHLFIAEKPSLAEAIAKARAEELGVTAKKVDNIYWDVTPDKVTWLFGHMYESQPPAHYNPRYKKWIIEDLPIVPEKWKLKVSADKKAHIGKITKLIKETDIIVNCGDAGREGQLLVDEVLEECQWDTFGDSTKRLWVSSMARRDMIIALGNMFPNKDKKPLYDAAVSRQRADWLHGMNLSRLFTLLAQKSGADVVISVGRVQTPTLKLIVDRDLEIERFRAVDHFMPTGLFKHKNGSFKAEWIIPEDYNGLDSEGRLIDKNIAQEIIERCQNKQGEVLRFSSQNKSIPPKLPFNLSKLQTECSAKFGLTAKQTLDVAQSLYEKHHATTYPRSDSQFLPVAVLTDEAPDIMIALSEVEDLATDCQNATMTLKSKAWNDSKITDHHGIIPTSEFSKSKLTGMSDIERKVFMLVAQTFIIQFYPDQRYKAISAEIGIEADRFKATGRVILDQGWQAVYKSSEEVKTIPEMEKGDPVELESIKLVDKRTKPPARFTDGTLIDAMTQIHKYVTDASIKKKLKENDGLGTEATRAEIIETVIRRKFTKRDKRNIISTTVGRSVIEILPDDITDPGMTALWENYLDGISKGENDLNEFMDSQIKLLKERISDSSNKDIKIKGAEMKSSLKPVKPIAGDGEDCPKCEAGKMITKAIYKGENKGNKFLGCDQYPECKSIIWPKEKVTPIEGDGESCSLCKTGQMQTIAIHKGEHKGKKFLGCNQHPDCKNVIFPEDKVDPIAGHGDTCSKCGVGKMKTKVVRKGEHKGNKFLGCDQYPDCQNITGAKIDPIEGDGEPCPLCEMGKMITRLVGKGEHKGEKFLSCDQYPDCKKMIWPENKSDQIEGHGEPCPSCEKGKLVTKVIRKGDKKGGKFLACDQYPDCTKAVWPEDKTDVVDQVEGHGGTCSKCDNGKMVTKVIRKGENKGKQFLACDQWPDCQNADFSQME